MKKFIYSVAIIAGALLATSCDDFLDRENYAEKNTASFPKTEQDAEQIVTACYNVLLLQEKNDVEGRTYFTHNMASDDMYGAGSQSNVGSQSFDRLMVSSSDFMEPAWIDLYKGVFRTNYALEELPNMDDAVFANKENKDYLIGQAYFLRAWFEWELTNNFETFPLLTSTAQVNNPKTDVETIYQQITSDLLEAIKLMPAKYGFSRDAGKSGRATKYAAEALLARIWMFYTGFYKKSDMCGVTKDQIVNYLKDVRDNSKFKLVNDPREIWPCTNEYSSGLAYGTNFDTYAGKNNLHWVGDRCEETIWAVHYSQVWVLNGQAGHNRLGEYFGMRNAGSSADDKCYPYGIGYSNGSVNPRMVEEWVTDPDYGTRDVRLWGSVMATANADKVYGGGEGGNWWNEGCIVELPNHPGNISKEVERTLFVNKKYMVVTAYDGADKSQLYNNFNYALGLGADNHNQYGQRNDKIIIRYADVLLMLDELTQSVEGQNKLRARAGLAARTAYKFEDLQKERRYELCFEAVRFNDIRRWYPDTAGQYIADRQNGGFTTFEKREGNRPYAEMPGNGMQKRYQECRGFQRIPQTQINLSEEVLTQNPGWENDKEADWFFRKGSLPYAK